MAHGVVDTKLQAFSYYALENSSKAQLSLWKSAAGISNKQVNARDTFYPCLCVFDIPM